MPKAAKINIQSSSMLFVMFRYPYTQAVLVFSGPEIFTPANLVSPVSRQYSVVHSSWRQLIDRRNCHLTSYLHRHCRSSGIFGGIVSALIHLTLGIWANIPINMVDLATFLFIGRFKDAYMVIVHDDDGDDY